MLVVLFCFSLNKTLGGHIGESLYAFIVKYHIAISTIRRGIYIFASWLQFYLSRLCVLGIVSVLAKATNWSSFVRSVGDTLSSPFVCR